MRVAVGHLLSIWATLGAILAAVAVSAWCSSGGVHGLIESLQRMYGAGPKPSILLRADAHVHLLVTCLLAIWLGLGCRLFAPRGLPWLPIVLAIIIAVSDEIAQIGSASRTFQWSDQIADGLGLLCALPVLLAMGRLHVYRLAHQNAATNSTPTRDRP
jgi:uncharacterized BrkB/YihY/UPF0761 family membrane protein